MGASLDFDATDKISLGAVNPLAGVSAASWSMWIQWADVTDTTQYWFGRDFGTSFNIAFDVNSVILRIDGTGGTFVRKSTSSPSALFSNNTWYNIAWVWDYNGGSQVVDLYIDGVLKTTEYVNLTFDDNISAMGTGTGDLNIGDSNLSGTYDFTGKIAYVKIWDKMLSQEEVLEVMYKPDSVMDNCQGYWPLWTTSPKDQSGNGNDGTNTGTVVDRDGPSVYFPEQSTG